MLIDASVVHPHRQHLYVEVQRGHSLGACLQTDILTGWDGGMLLQLGKISDTSSFLLKSCAVLEFCPPAGIGAAKSNYFGTPGTARQLRAKPLPAFAE